MYNTLYVPLNIGTWQCMLMPRSQYDTRSTDIRQAYRRRREDIERFQPASMRSRAGSSWSSSSRWDQQREDEAINRRLLEEDHRAFDLYFRPNWDLRSITGGQALDAVRSFLSEFLKVAHWDLPTDNAGVESALRKAVANGDLVPIVNRDQSSTPSTFRPAPAPLRWPPIGTSVSQVQPAYYGLKAAMPSGGGSAALAASSNAGYGSTLAAADVDAASSGDGFDWLGVAETVAGAALGSDDNSDGGDDTANSFAGADDEGGDTSTPLGDAQPFEYQPDTPDGDVEELAGSEGTPRNNQAQNKQFKAVVKVLGLNPSQARQLHEDISKQGLGYHEMLERGQDMFGGGDD
ncbi:conserved hypothetical protein [Burkholderia diffusa]|uniref:hypothetical protein n=1 Tax=Burkholderia diffusa TaxID=488732 RepID=UPI001CB0115A|nr:hypothetical protein [Burkholderia diffusa]CAG9264025.1 conserved hypothetical protein [Burkholderia diffusa]